MTGAAAAGFITRSFEAMLKECAGKKYPDLRSAVQKLIAYDHLEGDPGLEGGKNASLFTDMLNLVCGCVDNSSLDSTIVQVLQALLTAISSMRFRVHGDPLLGVIRVCYDIALNSKSLVNQATSKAMLTQMISIVFWRTETDQVPVSSGIADAGTPASNTSSENVEKSSDEKGEKNTVADALPKKHENDSSPSLEEFQNLASGADIKVLEAALDQAVQLEDGKKVSGWG